MNNPKKSFHESSFGELACTVVDGSDQPWLPVILCHGYGAPGDDLVGLTDYLIDKLGDAAKAVRFVYPVAPGDLADQGMPGGRAWWPLNMASLQQLLQTSQFDQLHDQTPPGIETASGQLVSVVQSVLNNMPADPPACSGSPSMGGETSRPYVLGGFSQGAMVTMNTALTGDIPPPDVLVQFSGTLVCGPQWIDAASKSGSGRLKATRVLQSHGTQDQILPFSSAATLADTLHEEALEWEFRAFQGPHTIEAGTLDHLAQWILDLTDRK
ncbi:MAG TPA: lysophospholipase [Rhodopirellula baltica]|uniref:Phospholipase/carboxylesterase family protein n=2 Tax=Rhodopirellula baltica TaxID=265606 RepID=L7CM39_RHOBT|nr:phospholipase/carboxylesterase [Rhodopirellula baltica]ELP35359.1 phospholipase/carboxylesterase family protein [Rhodopirellula baltica SWK14]HBE63812.1 lysophospholipase [Rhodopirellula baltica]